MWPICNLYRNLHIECKFQSIFDITIYQTMRILAATDKNVKRVLVVKYWKKIFSLYYGKRYLKNLWKPIHSMQLITLSQHKQWKGNMLTKNYFYWSRSIIFSSALTFFLCLCFHASFSSRSSSHNLIRYNNFICLMNFMFHNMKMNGYGRPKEIQIEKILYKNIDFFL